MKEEKLKTVQCNELLDVTRLRKDPHLKITKHKISGLLQESYQRTANVLGQSD
jgi:hypothetical protein